MPGLSRIDGYRKKWGPLEDPLLTAREGEVLRLVAQGKGNQEIGECLRISSHTVKVHLANIFEKLGVRRRLEAVAALSARPDYLASRASVGARRASPLRGVGSPYTNAESTSVHLGPVTHG